MSMLHRSLFLLSILLLAGCYHATVVTGLKPSTQTIEEHFAACWVYGLVPPATITTEAKCPHGVAKVETQLSFLNQLIGGLTLGIYTPVDIVVTCAEQSGTSMGYTVPDFFLGDNPASKEIVETFSKAADLAVSEHRTVYVEY